MPALSPRLTYERARQLRRVALSSFHSFLLPFILCCRRSWQLQLNPRTLNLCTLSRRSEPGEIRLDEETALQSEVQPTMPPPPICSPCDCLRRLIEVRTQAAVTRAFKGRLEMSFKLKIGKRFNAESANLVNSLILGLIARGGLK